MIPLTRHEQWNLQFAGPWGGGDHDMGKEGAVDEIHLVLDGKLLHNLSAALGIGSVVLGHHLNGPPGDATHFIDQFHSRRRRPLIPAAVNRPNACPMHLETDLDWLLCSPRRSNSHPSGECTRHAGDPRTDKNSRGLYGCPPGDSPCLYILTFCLVILLRHCLSPFV